MIARNVTVAPTPGERKFDVMKRLTDGRHFKIGLVMATNEQIAMNRARTLFSRMLRGGELLFVKERELVE